MLLTTCLAVSIGDHGGGVPIQVEYPLGIVYTFSMKPPRPHSVQTAIIVISLLLLLFAASLNGQRPSGSSLSGRVLDATTGMPLENANVFLAQTVLGVSTDEQGNFKITRIPPGTYRVVASRVGYQMQTQSVTVGESESFWREFNMPPRLLQAEEVQVSGDAQTAWKKNLSDFTEKFLGASDNASYCTILNPEVIAFRVDSISHDLVASSEDLISVENRALGYRVNIALGMFSWDLRRDQGQYLIYPAFEPLQTQRQDSLQFWAKNREENYQRSLQHFLFSLLGANLDKDKYDVNIGTLPFLRSGSRRSIGPGDVTIQQTDLWGMKRIMFNDWLMVEHYGERGGKETNYLALDEGAALVDSLGNLSDPMSVHVIGSWQDRRVADMLPLFWTRKRAGTE